MIVVVVGIFAEKGDGIPVWNQGTMERACVIDTGIARPIGVHINVIHKKIGSVWIRVDIPSHLKFAVSNHLVLVHSCRFQGYRRWYLDRMAVKITKTSAAKCGGGWSLFPAMDSVVPTRIARYRDSKVDRISASGKGGLRLGT